MIRVMVMVMFRACVRVKVRAQNFPKDGTVQTCRFSPGFFSFCTENSLKGGFIRGFISGFSPRVVFWGLSGNITRLPINKIKPKNLSFIETMCVN